MDRRSLLKLASTGALVSGLSGCAEGLLGQERSASQANPSLPKKFKKLLLVLALTKTSLNPFGMRFSQPSPMCLFLVAITFMPAASLGN